MKVNHVRPPVVERCSSCVDASVQINARYDANAEAEVISWFRQLTNTHIEPGMHHVEKAPKSGVELLR